MWELRDLFVFLDLLAWCANGLGMRGIASATGELAEAHWDEVTDQGCCPPRGVSLGQQFNAALSHHHLFISHWTNPIALERCSQPALQLTGEMLGEPYPSQLWVSWLRYCLSIQAWEAGRAAFSFVCAKLLARKELPKSPLLSSRTCACVCVCRLNEPREGNAPEGGWVKVECLNSETADVWIKASFLRKVSATTMCKTQREMIAAKGGTWFFLMFFRRRKILCVLTQKWSSCFCKMIFL